MSKDEAIKQRDECKHCHTTNLANYTFMLPYCTACLQAKKVLDTEWFVFRNERN